MVCESQHGVLYPLTIGDEVNFRLTYDGPLKAASQSETRRLEKQAIRCVFSRQLLQLYTNHDARFLDTEWESEPPLPVKRGEFGCLALIRERLNLVCDLDILFLRRENPGHLIHHGGDIDNRIKVLFDSLRVPQDDQEVRGCKPEGSGQGSNLLFCLTENDSLITGFRVTTDQLLEPPASPTEQNNVQLVINVEVKATKLTPENMAYFSHF
jgi:hypothetical protein